MRRIEHGHLIRATTPALERLARALEALPVRPKRAGEGLWRALLQRSILDAEERLQRAEELAEILGRGPSSCPEVPAHRIAIMVRWLDLGATRDQVKMKAPWAHAHELTIAMRRARERRA